MGIIERNIDKIRELCVQHNVASLFVFGSAVSNRFNSESDVDLLVDFKDVELYDYADNYFNLKSSLERIFKRKVDLLESKALNNPFLINSINQTKQVIYE